jgi:uncharacterized protein (TIGR00730 family)
MRHIRSWHEVCAPFSFDPSQGIDMNRILRRVAVFCGSNFGEGDRYREAAAALGREFAARGIVLVYGGTTKGLMGVLADAVIDAGGSAHGVITQRLADRGQLHARLSDHQILADMGSRKARMRELSDACIALPGGIGTVEEFMEAWTLNQLGDADKPVGLLNVDEFYAPFLNFIDSMIERKFLPAAHRASLSVASDPGALIDAIVAQPPITVSKWM